MVEVLAISLLWVAYWSFDNAGGVLAACSGERHSHLAKLVPQVLSVAEVVVVVGFLFI